MSEATKTPSETSREVGTARESTGANKPAFTPPKLTFVKPELVKQGGFAEVTGQFFDTFFP